jgi:hypothetical protein
VKQQDGSYVFSRKSRQLAGSVTALDVSNDSVRAAVGTADGELLILDASTLSPLFRDRKAHMVFATSVAFASDGYAVVSTSGDASARVTELPRGVAQIGLRLLLLVVLFFAAIVFGLTQELVSDPRLWLERLLLLYRGETVVIKPVTGDLLTA